jgi:hypothetical protein
MPEAPRLARQRRASTVRSAGAGSSPRSGEPAASSTGPDSGPVSSPFGPAADAGRTARRRDADVPESLEPPVVAVLPQFPRPGGHRDPTGGQPVVDAGRDDEPGRGDADRGEPDQEGSRRRFGLRRPRS